MALYDWSGNGKKDMVDDAIEYQMYKASRNCGDTPSEFPSGIGAVILMLLIMIAFPPVGILLLLIMAFSD